MTLKAAHLARERRKKPKSWIDGLSKAVHLSFTGTGPFTLTYRDGKWIVLP